jgi:hypothetical protein
MGNLNSHILSALTRGCGVLSDIVKKHSFDRLKSGSEPLAFGPWGSGRRSVTAPSSNDMRSKLVFRIALMLDAGLSKPRRPYMFCTSMYEFQEFGVGIEDEKDTSVPTPMKSAAKRDMSCESQNSANHATTRFRPAHVCGSSVIWTIRWMASCL